MAETSEELKRNNMPLGASGTDVIGKLHNANDHVTLLSSVEAAAEYDKMRRSDTQVRKVLTALQAPIKAATWSIPPVSDDQKDIDAAALMEQILFKDINWNKFLNEVTTFIPHGFSAFEVVHMNRENKSFGQYTGLAQLGFRKQSTITEWEHDTITGKLINIKQEAFGDIQVTAFIPAENLLLFFNEQEGDNIGFPICRILYGPWRRKLLATELQYIGMERNAINSPSVIVPSKIKPDDAEYIAAFEVLKAFTSAENQFLMIPDGWKLDWSTGSAFDPEKFEVVKKSEDEAMVGAIIASFLELGTGGNSGAFALTNDLSDFFFNFLINMANIPRDTINSILIPSLMEMNFGDTIETNPELIYSGISDKAGKETMDIITGYTKAGVITIDEALEDHTRKIHNLPKKAEGTQLDNQESEKDDGNGNGGLTSGTSNDDGGLPNGGDDGSTDNPPNGVELKIQLSHIVGHNHRFKGRLTGPAIAAGKKHFHELVESDGGITVTKKAITGKPHTHAIDDDNETGGVLSIELAAAPKNDARKLMINEQVKIVNTMQLHMGMIAEKYIADTIREYKKLPEKQKINATKNVKIGGQAKFRRELQAVFTRTSVSALTMAQTEVPGKEDVKLKSDDAVLLKQFGNYAHIKLNDFSKLPRRIQLLIGNQANLLSEKESKDIADVVSFQFFNVEGSTNDPEVIKQVLEDAAAKKIAAGTTETLAQDVSTLLVNETRQDFFFDDEVIQDIASFTYINSDPVAAICKKLTDPPVTVATNAVTLSPGFHQNCKTYLRANLKVSKNLPDVAGLPDITKTERDSITLKDA